jgi:hypothetical protein
MTSESPSVIKGVTPSVLAVPATTAPRFIPGLASSMVTPAAKKRARKTIKAKTAVVIPSEAPDSPVDIKEVESTIEASESPVVVAEEAKVELGDYVIEDEPLKITNAVEAVQKRIRAANKKIVSNLTIHMYNCLPLHRLPSSIRSVPFLWRKRLTLFIREM